MIQFDEDKQKRSVGDLLHREEEELLVFSAKYGIEYIDLSVTAINSDALRLVPELAAREAKVDAFDIKDKKIKIAVREPEAEKTVDAVEDLKNKGYAPTLYIASTAGLEKAWTAYKDISFAEESKAGSLDVSSEEISSIVEKAKGLPAIIALLEETLNRRRAIASRASSRPSSPERWLSAPPTFTSSRRRAMSCLRYRLDGVLQKVIRLRQGDLCPAPLAHQAHLRHEAQRQERLPGRPLQHPVGDGDIEVRASPSCPAPTTNPSSCASSTRNPSMCPSEDLGIHPKLLAILLKEIDRPDGMILTTGPTGSGKTTTLYAFLKKVHTPDVKIITIEDPIEYHLPGIVQTQVNDKGYNFLEGLRAAVRQDPDIIMVGEIRDNETADIAINSALTGHLVFSTLHTNDAAGTFPRLIDLGVNPKIITSALRIAMAQRLVRKLCPYCKKETPWKAKMKKKWTRSLRAFLTKRKYRRKKALLREHIRKSGKLSAVKNATRPATRAASAYMKASS